MSVYLPDNRITAPELWYPGRKPTVPVRINWSHPLAKDLTGFFLLQGTTFENLVDGKLYKTGTSPGIEMKGDSIYLGEGGYDSNLNLDGFSFNNKCSLTAIINTAVVMDRGIIDVDGQSLAFWVDSFNNDMRLALYSSSILYGPSGIFPANKDVTVGFSLDYNIGRIFQNGQFLVSGGIGSGSWPGTTSHITAGSAQSGATKNLLGLYKFLAVHKRNLSDDEMQTFQLNPYQILEAA